PREVQVDYDADRNTGVLSWKPSPRGRPAVSYRIYASDEKGFTASDEPYQVTTGTSKEKDLKSPFPANFLAETRAT
ncbi:MAG: hypothetical protein HY290_11610, partial [Planctomycetia bacterium]|nr:hypothetical protein [Planctomycetia bacterium]